MNKTYCIFAIHYLPHLGGVERYVYNLSKKLIEGGDRIYVVASNIEELPMLEKMEGVRVVRVPALNFMGGRFPVILPNKDFRKIHEKLKKMPVDMVIVNSRFYFHSLYGVFLAKLKGVPSIVIDHGTSHMLTGNAFADKIGELFEHTITLMERMLCRNYYGVSGEVTKWLRHFHIEARGVLYNSIDMTHIESLKAKWEPRFRKEYSIPEKAVTVTYTGRLVKEKGSLQLIQAANEVNKKRLEEGKMPIHVMIAGDGEIMEEVQSMASDTIHPLGRLPFEEIVGLLSESDIFCLPTAYPEGFPTSTLEAAACGCYPIVTPNGGARELIPDDSFGCVLEDNEPEKIAAALERVLEDPRYRTEAAEALKARVEEGFTWSHTASMIAEIAEQLSH